MHHLLGKHALHRYESGPAAGCIHIGTLANRIADSDVSRIINTGADRQRDKSVARDAFVHTITDLLSGFIMRLDA